MLEPYSYPMPVLAPVMTTTFELKSRPCKIESAVDEESNFCRSVSGPSLSSTANANLGSVYVVFLLMWLQKTDIFN